MTSVKYDYNFLAGYFKDDSIEFNSYNLLLHLYLTDQSELDNQIAFRRMDLIIHDIVDNCVFVNEDDIARIDELNSIGMRILTVSEPGPIDQIVQITLVDKLNAVTEGHLKIFESEIASLRGGFVKYIYYSNDQDELEYALVSADPTKWWNDLHPRFTPIDMSAKVFNFKHLMSWKELDLQWEEDNIADILPEDPDRKPANIITLVHPDK